jgi:hypothetical protein
MVYILFSDTGKTVRIPKRRTVYCRRSGNTIIGRRKQTDADPADLHPQEGKRYIRCWV